MKGQAFSIKNCSQYARLATGSQSAGNYTLIGQKSDLDNEDCFIKTINGKRVTDSMEPIVLRVNAWTCEPDTLDLDDTDAQTGVGNKR